MNKLKFNKLKKCSFIQFLVDQKCYYSFVMRKLILSKKKMVTIKIRTVFFWEINKKKRKIRMFSYYYLHFGLTFKILFTKWHKNLRWAHGQYPNHSLHFLAKVQYHNTKEITLGFKYIYKSDTFFFFLFIDVGVVVFVISKNVVCQNYTVCIVARG